jgi:hypothetical protein
MVEAAPPLGNKLRRPSIHLVGLCFGSGDGLIGVPSSPTRCCLGFSFLQGATTDGGGDGNGGISVCTRASWRSAAYLCDVSSGRRHRCQEDGSRSGASFFDISGSFTVFAGGGCIRFVYQLVWKPGCILTTTDSGSLPSLWGESSPGEWGLLMVEVSDPSLSDDVMASGHFFRPERSTTTMHIGVFDVLLSVPMKIFNVSSSGGWSASMSLLPPSATRTTGRVLQGLECNLYFFQGRLCKMWDVNYLNYM